MITQKYLKSRLSYNPASGDFHWRKLFHKGRENNVAGSENNEGYVHIRLLGMSYKAHRLVWLYVYGYIPAGEIDHINGNKLDNRLANLRVVNHEENCKNQKLASNNNTGIMGVGWHKNSNKWRARITVNGRNVALGHHNSFFDACCARKSAERLHGFHRNHGARK